MRSLLPLLATALAIALAAAPSAPARAPSAAVRVDQLGFAPGETKIAYLLVATPHPGAAFTVIDGQTVEPAIDFDAAAALAFALSARTS